MHEYEWLPLFFTKADMVKICNDFDLVVPGFRKDKLFTHNDEVLRNLIKDAIRKGIGEKKHRQGKGIIIISYFYEYYARLYLNHYTEWNNLSFDQIINILKETNKIKVYEKISIVYVLFKEEYIKNQNKFEENAINRKNVFASISNVDEENIIKEMIEKFESDLQYPSLDEYKIIIEDWGEKETFDKIMIEEKDKSNIIEKIAWMMSLSSFEQMLALILISQVENKLKATALRKIEEEKNRRYRSLEENINNSIVINKDIIKNISKNLKEKEEELEQLNQIFKEIVPYTKNAIIITENSNKTLKNIFPDQVFEKKYLIDEIQKKDKLIKGYIWFIDRLTILNIKEWIKFKNYFNQNGYRYEEYTDINDLFIHYIILIKNNELEVQ